MLSNTIRYFGAPENSQGIDLLAYDPDDPNDPYNDPHDPNRHRPGDTWEIGGKPFDPYDPGPWLPGRVRRPDTRTGRHRRGELPDPLPDGPQYDITTGLAYPITESQPAYTPPQRSRRRRFADDRPSPRPHAVGIPSEAPPNRYGTGGAAVDPEHPLPRFAVTRTPLNADPCESVSLYGPLGPSKDRGPRFGGTAPTMPALSVEAVPTVAIRPAKAERDLVAVSAGTEATASEPVPAPSGPVPAPGQLPSLAEGAWQRFLTHSAELHLAHYHALASMHDTGHVARRLVWMLRWMLTVLVVGLVRPPAPIGRRDGTEARSGREAEPRAAEAGRIFESVRAAGGAW